MATSGTGSDGSTATEMGPEKRPQMPTELFEAAIEGNRDVLVRRLGLPDDGEHNHSEVQIDPPEPTLQQMEIQSDIQSATTSGNTILHLLVTHGHNEFALKVFHKEMSLLKARNKKSETPLHCAAKVGNNRIILNLIQLNSGIVKDALGKTNDKGDTSFHVAAKHGNIDVFLELMKLDPRVARNVNKEGLSPLHVAIANGYTTMAIAMLNEDAPLACIEDADGMFPVHVATRKGNKKLVMHFIEEYPNYAELLDPRGRNLFHVAAEEKCDDIFEMLYHDADEDETDDCISYDKEEIKRMINALDYEGNTPLHIAAMKGHWLILQIIWVKGMHHDSELVQNKQGLTPLEVSIKQLKESSEADVVIGLKIRRYIHSNIGNKFTERFFYDFNNPSDKNIWDKIQVIGLGSVLITTVAFAAAFTVPGGYNQENGTPVLGRRYIFRAFILANALAFITAFMSLFSLLNFSLSQPDGDTIRYSLLLFLAASSSMVVAFGLGLYVTLAPINMHIAVLILVVTTFTGSSLGHSLIILGKEVSSFLSGKLSYRFLVSICLYSLTFLCIFGLAYIFP